MTDFLMLNYLYICWDKSYIYHTVLSHILLLQASQLHMVITAFKNSNILKKFKYEKDTFYIPHICIIFSAFYFFVD